MSGSTKQFHETNFLVCHVINILLTLVGYLRDLDIDLTKKIFFLPSTLDPRPSTLEPRPLTLDMLPSTLDPRQKPTLSLGKCCLLSKQKVVILVVLQTVNNNKQELCLPHQFNYNGEGY